MTNPNNAVGTDGAYGGRTSVNAFNDTLAAYARGIMSGWECIPNTGLNLYIGGTTGRRDVAIAEDDAGNKTTINNISEQPINITISPAPLSNSRIDLIVGYVDSSPQGTSNEVDNPGVCGLIVVKGTVAVSPTEPDDNDIRTAITADGADGLHAYYVILASVTIASGTTTITSGMINPGVRTEVPLISSVLSEPTTIAYVDTANLMDNAVTAKKTNFGGNYSASEQNTGFTWIDGKYIYKKTVDTGALPNATEKTVAHGISNLGRVIKIEGYAYNGNNDATFPLPFSWATNTSSCVGVLIGTTTINIRTGVDRTDYAESYITLYYTKSS